ncbi:helix-turn-helix domain-containing protein [Peribacillus asahii]|uniref:helix-turn-helix domain-containing protein n=1 Tax=Peribacillus asahii TaxID=228899 RepID=UPI00207A665F|nr:helix-turn-helix domain-containing protein [Peribacillus asahii]USK62263.1 helix-turn-helix domain-containing protein [Peribacillus asahii]
MLIKIWECDQRGLWHILEDGTRIHKKQLNPDESLYKTLVELLPGEFIHFIYQRLNNGFNLVEMIHIVETYKDEEHSTILTAFYDSFYITPNSSKRGFICNSVQGDKIYHFNGVSKQGQINVEQFAEWYLNQEKEDFILHNIVGVGEAAELMKYAPGTVKNWCAMGRIKAKKIGTSWAINKMDLK